MWAEVFSDEILIPRSRLYCGDMIRHGFIFLFYLINHLPQSSGLSAASMAGAAHLYALDDAQLGG